MDIRRGGEIIRGDITAAHSQFALFDRIINVKLIRQNGDSFVVRSDYEVQKTYDGTPFFVQVRQKPSIVVTYKQVANSVSIQLQIRITNLHILNMTADEEILSVGNNPITGAVVQMGYRNQFPNWARPPLASDTDETADPEDEFNRLRMFNEMAGFTVTDADRTLDTLLQIECRVLYVHAETLPPDRVTNISCVIGNMSYGLTWARDAGLRQFLNSRDLRSDMVLGHTSTRPDMPLTRIEVTLFALITRRFVRQQGMQYAVVDSRANPKAFADTAIPEGEIKQKLLLRGMQRNDAGHIVPDPTNPEMLEVPLDENGVMTVEDAIDIGVICMVSPGVARMSQSNTLPRGTGAGLTTTAYVLERYVGIRIMPLLEAQVTAMVEAFPDLRYFPLVDGNLFFYSVNENISDLVQAMPANRREARPILLPAVYDVSIGALRHIRCPFAGFISPLQLIGFSSRYLLGDMVGFFFPSPRDHWFRALLIDVEFGTVEDRNKMTIMCVDAPPQDVALLAGEETEEEQTTEEAVAAMQRTLRWRAVQVGRASVVGDDGQVVRVPRTWWNIAEHFVLNNSDIYDVEEGVVAGITHREAVEFLLANPDNETLNDANLERGPETSMPAELEGLELGVLYEGDDIYVPYIEYTSEEDDA